MNTNGSMVRPLPISVLIPVKNGAQTLAVLLAQVRKQSLAIDEIIVADSGSSDSSLSIAQQYGARILVIDPSAFDHGGTRTLLAQEARGELLLFFTQDAVPVHADALQNLIAPLLENPTVGSSFGRQIPCQNADYFASSLRRFNYPERDTLFSYADKDLAGLQVVFTSNSFACYRKSALQEIGFFQNNLIFGEDTIAVAQLLKKGYRHAYVAKAAVYHSHNYSLLQDFKRYFDIGVLHTREQWFLQEYGGAKSRGKAYIVHEFRSIMQVRRWWVIPELFFRLLVKSCAYKLGRMHRKLPCKLNAFLSMNKNWWNRQ